MTKARGKNDKRCQEPSEPGVLYSISERAGAWELHDGGTGRSYDLEERTARFGEAVIIFARSISGGAVTSPLINQLVRSGTSVGANYCEADNAVSKKEFRLKIATCQKEARETKHWLRMLATASPDHAAAARELWLEARQLHLIFSAILRKT